MQVLEKKLNYSFRNQELLREALNHSSYANEPRSQGLGSNERLEFLGGSVLGFSSADSSSTSKGETVTDTIRTVGCYCDIIAMRHPKEGAPYAAAQYYRLPCGRGVREDGRGPHWGERCVNDHGQEFISFVKARAQKELK